MSIVQLGALLVATAILAGVVVTWFSPGRWLRRRSGRSVVVHTTTDRSIEGTLMVVARDGLVLAGARYLDADTDLGGEIYVPAEQVAWMQLRS